MSEDSNFENQTLISEVADFYRAMAEISVFFELNVSDQNTGVDLHCPLN